MIRLIDDGEPMSKSLGVNNNDVPAYSVSMNCQTFKVFVRRRDNPWTLFGTLQTSCDLHRASTLRMIRKTGLNDRALMDLFKLKPRSAYRGQKAKAS